MDAERFEPYLGDADGVMWTIEADPLLRLTFVAIALLDERPEWDLLVRRVDRASRVIPRLRQVVVPTPLRLAPPRWVYDAQFDLGYHLRRVEAPPPRDLDAVLELARVAGMSGFDRARPLWEFTLVEGLEDGRAALIQKIHHSVTDGIGGVRLATELYEAVREPDDIEVLPDPPPPESYRPAELAALAATYSAGRLVAGARRLPARLARVGLASLLRPRQTLRQGVAVGASIARVLAPGGDILSPVMRGRSTTWRYGVLEYPMADLRDAAHGTGGTVNHAFVAAVAGGFGRYHEHHGTPVDALRVTMPISYRAPDDALGGNRFLPARPLVPVAIADPAERIRQIGDLCTAWQHEPALPLTDAVSGVLNVLPAPVTTAVIGAMVKHDDFTTSNVPGLPGPTFLAGSLVERLWVCGSPSGAAADVVLMSHADTACIGVTIDVAAIPDPEVLLGCLSEGFDEVLHLGGGAATRSPEASATMGATR